MRRALIKDHWVTLLTNSNQSVGEIMYSILVNAKMKNIRDIRELSETAILAASEKEVKALTDKPMSDTEFRNWIESKGLKDG